MVSLYILIAVRHLKKKTGYTLLNIGGISIGIACCIQIGSYIQYELSYDRFNERAERIFRLADEYVIDTGVIRTAGTPAPWGPMIQQEFPEVEQFVRMRGTVSAWFISYMNKSFYERRVFWVDEHVFDVFSFPLIQGNSETALSSPYTLVISETAAKKYFGEEDPIGKVINADQAWDFTVTGVMKDIPSNAHFSADFFVSFTSLSAIYGPQIESDWLDHNNYYTYLLLSSSDVSLELEKKLTGFIEKHVASRQTSGASFSPFLQPLLSIHLHSQLDEELEPNSDLNLIYVFAGIALLIIAIAGINYINLSTSEITTRVKNVELLKAVGASRLQLIELFFAESVVLMTVATITGLVVARLTQPVLFLVSGIDLHIDWYSWWIWCLLAGSTLVVCLVAGSYSVFMITRQRVGSGSDLKGSRRSRFSSDKFRQVLVVFQFTASMGLIIAYGIIHSQLEYIQNKDLGFSKDQVIIMPIPNVLARQGYKPFKQKAELWPGVVAVSSSTAFPGTRLIPQEAVRGIDNRKAEYQVVPVIAIDYGYIETMDVELVAGRDFSPGHPTDMSTAFILNESAVKHFGWSTPQGAIGKPFERMRVQGKNGTVVGVVKDFHLRSFYEQMGPVVLYLSSRSWYILVRVRKSELNETLSFLKDTWSSIRPEFPFEYVFLDAQFDQLHRSDRQFGQVVGVFSIVAIMIACLGLLGLTAFMIQQRTKELGIRRVLGASVFQIMIMLSSEYLRLLLISSIVAFPLSYLAMDRWLQTFAYQTELTVSPFMFSALTTVLIASVTIGIQTLKAAYKNPIVSLRHV